MSPFIVTTSQPGCSACGQELERRDGGSGPRWYGHGDSEEPGHVGGGPDETPWCIRDEADEHEPDTTVVLSRLAVATLEEAQRAVHDADEIGTVEDLLFDLAQAVMRDDPQLHWDRDRGLIYQRAWDRLVPESGGTVGPLPDGTTIQVEPRQWHKLARDSDDATLLASALQLGERIEYWPGVRESILTAWNAKHDHA